MFYKKLVIILSSLMAPLTAIAQNNSTASTDQPLANIVTAFTHCDNQFFQEIAKNSNQLNQYHDLIIKEEQKIGYLPVDDVENMDKNSLIFKKPILYNGLEIVGYQNIFGDLYSLGQYYYWGFIINNSADEVKKAFNQFNWQPYSATSLFANAQIYDTKAASQKWQPNPYSISEIAPKTGTIEKMLYIESTPNQSEVRLFCTLQGDISKEMLYKLRPDMQTIDKEIEAKRQEKKLKRAAERQKKSNAHSSKKEAI